MAKKIEDTIKLQIPAGSANPAPPVGPALGRFGLNIMEFCKAFNAQTAEKSGSIIPVVITVYSDRSFSFVLKNPPVSDLLKKAAKIKKGASNPKTQRVATLSRAQVQEIAETKMSELNANDIDAAILIVAGTARSMGIAVEEAK